MSEQGRLGDAGSSVALSSPQRTCVGCRSKAAKSDLLRVAAVDGVLLPDARARQPGRGAYIHPTTTCLELAIGRRSFARALRLSESPDPAEVRLAVDQFDQQQRTTLHAPPT